MNYIEFNNQKVYPSKVVCIGRNYAQHIEELKNEMPEEMVFFIKPNSSISTDLKFPSNQDSCHYEGELSFLIKDNKFIGVAFGLDLTLREIQSKLKSKGLPWERAKAFNKSAVFTSFVPLSNLNNNIDNLGLELYINGELKQKGNISMMLNKPYEIMKEALSFVEFEDYDILMTGTPKGVGSFKKNDIFNLKILNNEKMIIDTKLQVM